MRDLPCPSVNVNFLPRDFTRLNGQRHFTSDNDLDSLFSSNGFCVLFSASSPFLFNEQDYQ
eukprot:COSAG04_NODE_2255_length_4440_cov_25.402952_7_plen_61_part_00